MISNNPALSRFLESYGIIVVVIVMMAILYATQPATFSLAPMMKNLESVQPGCLAPDGPSPLRGTEQRRSQYMCPAKNRPGIKSRFTPHLRVSRASCALSIRVATGDGNGS